MQNTQEIVKLSTSARSRLDESERVTLYRNQQCCGYGDTKH